MRRALSQVPDTEHNVAKRRAVSLTSEDYYYYHFSFLFISMSEIEDIADMEFDELLEHVDLGKLDIVESCSRG